MTGNQDTRISVENVCKELVSGGMISPGQAKKIVQNSGTVRKRLEVERTRRMAHLPPERRIVNPVTAVDIVVALKARRADDPPGGGDAGRRGGGGGGHGDHAQGRKLQAGGGAGEKAHPADPVHPP